MKTLIRAELDKLRTLHSTWIVLVLSVVLTSGIAAVVLATSKHLRDAPSQIAGAAFGLSGLTAGILCAVAFAAEYQDGTINTTLTLVPTRSRVVGAKAVAAMCVGSATAAAATAACYVVTAVWLGQAGASWPWSIGQLAQAAVGTISAGALIALGGVGIGALTQKPALAGTAMGLIWLGLSNLLATFVAFFRHYGIVAAEVALAQPSGRHAYSFLGALIATAGLAAVLLLAGLRRVQLGDVS